MADLVLHVIEGPAAGRRLTVDSPIVFGRRGGDAEALGGDPELSRGHARVRERSDGALELEDLGSTNGTRVNGERIRGPMRLRPGDRIAMGTSVVEVCSAESVAETEQSELPPGVATTVRPPRPPLEPTPAPPPAGPPPPAPALARTPESADPLSARFGPGMDRPQPGAAPPRGPRVGVTAALVVLSAAVAVIVTLALAGKLGGGAKRAAAPLPYDGTVYVMSNRSQPSANSVIAFHYRDGSLAPVDLQEYPTGGSGAFDQSNSGVLDAVDEIAVNPQHTELFAVNTSSDTIAAFHIAADGTLTPVPGSPFPSGGPAPASVNVRGNVLIVANKAADGVRKSLNPIGNYASLPIAASGALGPPISTVSLAPKASATQAFTTPDGTLMIGSVEAGEFVVLHVAANGALSQAEGSPFALPRSQFPVGRGQPPYWPQGIAVLPTSHLVYANVSNAAKLLVYSYNDSGQLTFIRAVRNAGSILPCWTELNAAGTRLYTDNAGNDTMSVFDIGSDPQSPTQLQTVKLKTNGNPWNLDFDATGRYLFVVNPRAASALVGPGQGNTVHSLQVNPDGTLTELAASPVQIPVGTNTQALGLVAIGNR